MGEYVIVDIGCIECGEETEVVGIYSSMKQAEADYKAYLAKVEANDWGAYFHGGQHSVELIAVQPVAKKEKKKTTSRTPQPPSSKGEKK